MWFDTVLLTIALISGTLRTSSSTCVLESDFGFKFNCALKKSGLFRVRNLGGVKAHVGMGLQLGDELGFKESLSNTEEIKRRRSVTEAGDRLRKRMGEVQRQGKLDNSFMRSPVAKRGDDEIRIGIVSADSLPSAFHALKKSDLFASMIPPFKPIPPAPERPAVSKNKPEVPAPTYMGIAVPKSGVRHNPSRFSDNSKPKPEVMAVMLPFSKNSYKTDRFGGIDFDKLGNSDIELGFKHLPDRLNAADIDRLEHRNFGINKSPQFDNFGNYDRLSSTDFALRTLPAPSNDIPQTAVPQTHTNALHSFLAANNITEELLEAALFQRQQTLLAKARLTTTTTTTPKPRPRPSSSSVGKVMNAPKEYYPVGYDKNFDDNFASRVELPETSFYCGDQKHFPGLYADEDLGCMVFHVCALTDDGLIAKSFLCPESTLFDQAILKCNWWFYVDCKSSKKLYDSNIPVSKSYQLMKALTFFSGYKKEVATSSKPSEKPE